MSAHRQSKAHIDAIVTAAVTLKVEGIAKTNTSRENLVYAHNGIMYRVVNDGKAQHCNWCTDTEATDLGKMLWDENTKSLMHLYREYDGEDDYGTYEPTRHLTLAELCTAIDGYMYQSCEHPEWLASAAYAVCIELKAEALSISTRSQRDDVKTWSIDEETVRKPKSMDDALGNRDFFDDHVIVMRVTGRD